MKKLMMIAIMMIAAVSANAQNEAGQASIKPMAGINLATMTKTDDSKMRVGLGFNVKKKVAVEVAGVKDDATVDDVKGFALSIPVGLSYEFSNVVLDARYNLGLTKAIKDADSKHSYFTITLGYRIPF